MRGRRISSAEPRAAAATAVAAAAALWFATAAGAQQPPAPASAGPRVEAGDGWNSESALRLIERAIEARRHAWADSSLERFRAETRSHVYYLGDFLGERHVIRADQIALDVRWQAPDRTMQTIVGRRHERRLPTTVEYHLDHLFLILDNFGDRIRLGDGYEIENVRHPAGERALELYEYRLSDSLEIRLRDRTARVFELEVRPREATAAAAVGSLFVDRETGAIARMRLTFTRAAYRDPQIVRLVVDLRSALWEGRYWLPDEQDVEITRSLPWFDFPLQTLVRTRLRVLDYHFDEEPVFSLAPGQVVYSYPEEDLARFDAWETSLYAGPHEAETTAGDLDEVVADARGLLLRQRLFGGGRWQLALPNASAGLRARRSEGLLLGAGGSYRADDVTRVSFWGGYPMSDARPQASLGVRRRRGPFEVEMDGWLRANRDAGPAAAAGVLRTLALLAEGEDYEGPLLRHRRSDGDRAPHRNGAVARGRLARASPECRPGCRDRAVRRPAASPREAGRRRGAGAARCARDGGTREGSGRAVGTGTRRRSGGERRRGTSATPGPPSRCGQPGGARTVRGTGRVTWSSALPPGSCRRSGSSCSAAAGRSPVTGSAPGAAIAWPCGGPRCPAPLPRRGCGCAPRGRSAGPAWGASGRMPRAASASARAAGCAPRPGWAWDSSGTSSASMSYAASAALRRLRSAQETGFSSSPWTPGSAGSSDAPAGRVAGSLVSPGGGCKDLPWIVASPPWRRGARDANATQSVKRSPA